MTDDLQFRADRGLVINQYCHVLMKPYYYSRYSSIDDSSYGDAITPIMYQEHEFHCDESCFYPLPPNTPTPPPLLRILSHDIEAAGKNFTNPYTNIKQSRFPVPLWRPKTIADAMEDQNKQFQIVLAATLRDHGSNSDEYRKLIPNRGLLEELMKEIKDTVGNPKKFKPWSNLSEWYENIHDKYQALEPYIVIPDPLDTDPAIMIVTALDIYNKPRTKPLHFPDSHAFVYTHPKMKKKIVKTRQVGASADINDEYEAMNLHTYSSELDMIAAFAEYIHECQPSIFTGWNIDNFDFPYLWERCQFYHIYFDEKYSEHGDTKCKANPFGTPNFGLLREIPCKYIEGKQFSTPSGVEDNSDPELKDDKKKTEYQNKNEFYIDEETGMLFFLF